MPCCAQAKKELHYKVCLHVGQASEHVKDSFQRECSLLHIICVAPYGVSVCSWHICVAVSAVGSCRATYIVLRCGIMLKKRKIILRGMIKRVDFKLYIAPQLPSITYDPELDVKIAITSMAR